MRVAWILCFVIAHVAPALAQTGPPPAGTQVVAPQPLPPRRVHGTIVSFDGNELQVKPDTGDAVSAGVGPDSLVLYDEQRRFADIKIGDFLGIAATTASDGTLHAQEVRIFPASLRGTGEGHYPMGDPGSNRTMTNATVAVVNAVFNGGTLDLSYHGAAVPAGAACSGHAAQSGTLVQGKQRFRLHLGFQSLPMLSAIPLSSSPELRLSCWS